MLSFHQFINESSSKLEVEELNSLLQLGLIEESEYLLQLSDALILRGTPLQTGEFLESMPIFLIEFDVPDIEGAIRKWRGPAGVRAIGATGEIFEDYLEIVIFVSNGDRIYLNEDFSGYGSIDIDLYRGAKVYRLPSELSKIMNEKFFMLNSKLDKSEEETNAFYHNLFNEAVNLAH